MGKYESKNAQNVLDEVDRKLDGIYEQGTKCYCIDDVYDELSIFDWWDENLNKSRLLDMQRFLREAIKLGYTGYVCFKVGAAGCANGMWAHKKESTDGYSPDGELLYKSFTPSYEYWSVKDANGVWYPDHTGERYDSCKTIKQLEQIVGSIKGA